MKRGSCSPARNFVCTSQAFTGLSVVCSNERSARAFESSGFERQFSYKGLSPFPSEKWKMDMVRTFSETVVAFGL